jgi:hypothetical protein
MITKQNMKKKKNLDRKKYFNCTSVSKSKIFVGRKQILKDLK